MTMIADAATKTLRPNERKINLRKHTRGRLSTFDITAPGQWNRICGVLELSELLARAGGCEAYIDCPGGSRRHCFFVVCPRVAFEKCQGVSREQENCTTSH